MAQKRPFPFNDPEDKDLQCSVCLKTYVRPKILPCSHTFCYKCLKTICDDALDYDSDDELSRPCPLCRTDFRISDEGAKSFPDNDFIQRRVLEKQMCEVKRRLCICDLCVKQGKDVKAEWYCIDCKENLCHPCKINHFLTDYLKLHKVVKVTSKPTEEELNEIKIDYCAEHKKEIEFYCNDCDELLCCVCLVPEHCKHDFTTKHIVSDKKKEPAAQDRINIERCIENKLSILTDLSEKEAKLVQNISQVRESIEVSYGKLVGSIMSNKAELLARIDKLETEHTKQIIARKDLVQLHEGELSSFLESSITLMEGGSDKEIITQADMLHEQAKGLVEWHELNHQSKQDLPDETLVIKFLPPPDLTAEDLKRLTGALDVTTKQDLASEFINGHTTVEYINHEKNVTGVTVVDDQIFVVESQLSYINVYDCRTLLPQPHINVPDLKNAVSLAGCSLNKTLYVSDSDVKCIHTVSLADNSVGRWEYKNDDVSQWIPHGLSVTSEGNLLVASETKDDGYDFIDNRLIEVGSDGEMLIDIDLNIYIKTVWQTVQVSRERLIFCHGSGRFSPHRLYVTDLQGKLIKSYGGERGRGEGHLYQPTSISMDSSNTFLFVADQWNDRILIFSSALTLLGQVQACEDLKYPSSLCFDSNNNQLIVCETFSGRVLVIRRAES